MTYLIIAIVCLLAVIPVFRLLTIITKRRNRRSVREVADMIERHVEQTEGPWDWDEFTSLPIADNDLDTIRIQCIELENVSPEERMLEMKGILQRLRNRDLGSQPLEKPRNGNA